MVDTLGRRKKLLEDREIKKRLVALGISPAPTRREILAAHHLEYWNSLTPEQQKVETKFRRLDSIYYKGDFGFNSDEVSQEDIDWYSCESIRRAIESDEIAEEMYQHTSTVEVFQRQSSNIERLATLN